MTSSAQAIVREWTPRLWYVSTREWLGRFPFWILQLGLRVGVGLVFFNAGLLKYGSFDSTIALFRDVYKVPLLPPAAAAGAATFFELACPILLFAGLATRFATLPLLGELVVIELFVFPVTALSDNLFWGTVLIFILTRGPGVFSLDYLIERYFTKHPYGMRT
ncbi:MAG TPA: DoxX family protein [Gemmataceae bacterium]